MKTTRWLALTLLAAALFDIPSAQAVTVNTVDVGNPGNAPDVHGADDYGSVAYKYRIATTEVTNAQYVEFLNGVDPTGANAHGLYSSLMTSNPVGGIVFNGGGADGFKFDVKAGRDNNPVLLVSWYDAIRFANWLHNDQGNGDTEDGAYTLPDGEENPNNGISITRNPGAKWFLPTQDEWYKAAYHRNDGVTGNYWDYPTSTDLVPYSDQPPGSDAFLQSDTANFYRNDDVANSYDDGYAVTGSPSFDFLNQNYLTDVGAYALSTSPYGTFDQGGNVFEWNETVILESFRGNRGGSWSSDGAAFLHAAISNYGNPANNYLNVGFRVATFFPIDGDYDLDRDVDGNDFLVWQRGSSPDPLSAGDLVAWQSNFGASSLAASVPIPEPRTVLLAAMAGVGLLGLRRKRFAI